MGSGQFFQTLVDEIGEALISWTSAGEITSWNRAAEALLGYRREDVLGRNAALLVPTELLSEHEILVGEVIRTGRPVRIATSRCRADGELINVSLSLSRICDEAGDVVGVGCLVRSRTRAARLINRLRSRAYTDHLTRVLNRSGLEQHLGSSNMREEAGLRAVVFIDLDGFKRVNDEAGHCCGDQLLRRCARRIRKILGDDGPVFCRWGGDEFVVILKRLPARPPAARRAVEVLCGRLFDALRPAYRFGDRAYHCPASIGACVYDACQTAYADALEIADRAMYQVKAGEKNAFFIDTTARRYEDHRGSAPRLVRPGSVSVFFGALALP